MNESDRNINLGGGWAILFKVALATYPLVVGLGVWVFNVLRDHDQRLARVESTTFSVDYRTQLITDIGVLKATSQDNSRRLDRIEQAISNIEKVVKP